MKRMMLLLILALLPLWGVAEESFPDLTGKWTLEAMLVDGSVQVDGGNAYELTLRPHTQAEYRRNGEALQGYWFTPTPEQVVVIDQQGRQYAFTLVQESLIGTDGGASIVLARQKESEALAAQSLWQPLPNADNVPGFDLVAQSDVLELYAKASTGEIAIFDKRNGRTIWSNPQDAAEDSGANSTNRRRMQAQFYLEYINENLYSGSFCSCDGGVENGSLLAWTIPNGVAFGYDVFEEQTIYYVPHYLSDVRFQELYEGADEHVRRLMYGQENSFYARQEDGSWQISANGARLPMRSLRMMFDAFVEMGMTEEEYWGWQALAGVYRQPTLGFSLVMEWTLEGDVVSCSIPAESIEERRGLTLTHVAVAPWLGAVRDQTAITYQVESSDGLVDVTGTEAWNYRLSRVSEDVWNQMMAADVEATRCALISDDAAAILVKAPVQPRRADFQYVPAGTLTSYGAFYYQLRVREAFDYSQGNWAGNPYPGGGTIYPGEIWDVDVSYQILDEPFRLVEYDD